jgi:hypothetical protein
LISMIEPTMIVETHVVLAVQISRFGQSSNLLDVFDFVYRRQPRSAAYHRRERTVMNGSVGNLVRSPPSHPSHELGGPGAGTDPHSLTVAVARVRRDEEALLDT